MVIHTSKEYRDIMNIGCSNLKFKALGLNCGIYNIDLVNKNPILRVFLSPYFGKNAKQLGKQLYPLRYQNKKFPPAFVFTSKDDFFKNYQQPLLDKLRENNTEYIFTVYGQDKRNGWSCFPRRYKLYGQKPMKIKSILQIKIIQ